MEERTLITIGAGPKAMALAAKVTALENLGVRAPRLHIIEKNAIAANWKGLAGFTNGRLELGTSPEKDVGFPYRSSVLPDGMDRALDREMFRFSWTSYLIGRGLYSEWIDRGRPAPTHAQWAEYLCFVADNLSPNIRLVKGTVERIDLRDRRWNVLYRDCKGDEKEVAGEGLVLTGPGKQKTPFRTDFPGVFSLEDFWNRIEVFRTSSPQKVAVVGNGENAASMVLALLELQNPGIEIELISPAGFVYSRGESYFENRVYSDPACGNWESLSAEHRREFVRRTDLGVFSLSAVQKLNQAARLKIVPGSVSEMREDDGGIRLTLVYGKKERFATYDKVVLATGFDQALFLRSLLSPEGRATLRSELDLPELDSENLSQRIGADLALEGLHPRLHLPMLSGLRQGPGFANLSCLGQLSDRILQPYLGISE